MDNQEQSTSFGHTIVIFVLIIVITGMLIGFVMQYVTYNSDYLNKKQIERFYVKKDEIDFSDLPQHIRIQYVTKLVASETEKRLNDNIKMIEKSTITDQYLDNITLVKQIECDRFKPASHIASASCRNKLQEELSDMNQNMIYEIIPMVNNKDFDFIKRMVNENLNENDEMEYKEKMDDFMEYANRGLSHFRANEAIWMLKQSIGKDVKIRNSSFHMFTKDKAGFIIKVFNYIE